MNQIQGIVETAIYAEDLDAALLFYRDLLGLEFVTQEKDRHVFFRVGTSNMLLIFRAETTLQGDHLPPHGAIGPSHFAFAILAESLPYWRQRLAQYGVAIEKEVTWPTGSISLYFRDPAGNAVELLTPGLWGLPSGW